MGITKSRCVENLVLKELSRFFCSVESTLTEVIIEINQKSNEDYTEQDNLESLYRSTRSGDSILNNGQMWPEPIQ